MGQLGYQTQYTDPSTGDVLMQSRWYTPGTATFRSRDTYAGDLNTPVSLNRYTYANNNPIRYSDPTGRCIDFSKQACWDINHPGEQAPKSVQIPPSSAGYQVDPASVGLGAGTTVYTTTSTVQSASQEQFYVFVDNRNQNTFDRPIDDLVNWDLVTLQQIANDPIHTPQEFCPGGKLRKLFCGAVERAASSLSSTIAAPLLIAGDPGGFVGGIWDMCNNPAGCSGGFQANRIEEFAVSAAENGYSYAFGEIFWDAGEVLIGGGVVRGGTRAGVRTATRNIDLPPPASQTRVGRWMGPDEYQNMVNTNQVQVGQGGTTYVARPADPAAFYRQASPGSVYAEFDVPTSSLRVAGQPNWAQIPSPDHILARLKNGPPIDFPIPACNIIQVATKSAGC